MCMHIHIHVCVCVCAYMGIVRLCYLNFRALWVLEMLKESIDFSGPTFPHGKVDVFILA